METDTIPKVLLRNAEIYGDRKVALVKKEYGIWHGYTWRDCYELSRGFSLGLISLGLEWGDKVSIIGDNDPHWIIAEWATLCAGSISTGIYQDCLADEVKYAITNSDSKFVVAEDQEQVDKVLAHKNDLPQVKKVIYWDPKGLTKYDDPALISFDQVVELGREYERAHPGLFEENIRKVKPEDLARISWTSGTTAFPKGVLCNHAYPIHMAELLKKVSPLYEGDQYFFASPLAWESLMAGRCFLAGAVMNFPEEPETTPSDLREVAPHAMILVPRLLEGMLSSVQVGIEDSSFLKRLVYRLFMPVGYKKAAVELGEGKSNLMWKALYPLGNLLLFRPLRDSMGFTRVRSFLVGGARIGEDLFRFYHAIGIQLRAMYALMEGGGYLITHKEGDIRVGTAGTPSPGVLVRISDDGEILIKGPAMFEGYYGNPEATNATLDEKGWVHSGDAGIIEDDGHLICVDRMEDVMTLVGGAKLAPGYIESSLKFSPYIKDAAIIGEGREFVTALISVDYGNVGSWAEKRQIAYTTFADLSQKREVYELIQQEIGRVNRVLPEATKVKRYVVLYKELDADDAELTRTRKVRRRTVGERYKALVEALYGDRRELMAETEVTYRDGRKALTKTQVTIADVGDDR